MQERMKRNLNTDKATLISFIISDKQTVTNLLSIYPYMFSYGNHN